MCLRIYRSEEEMPENMDLVDYNDIFFDGTELKGTDMVRCILKEIDKAEYASEDTFIGRDRTLGKINKQHLSTGCKTLLNVVQNPDKCFDVIECGQNVLSLLHYIKEGNILWKNPILHFVGDAECDIEIDDKRFTDFRKFLSYIMD